MKPTLLIIDDEPQNIELAEIVLQKEGYRLLHAEDGEAALQVLSYEAVEVIVLDLMMPRLDGFGLLERLKADEALRRIPVLVVTALGETSHRTRAESLGADAYLVKPYDIIDLKTRVKAMLNVAQGSAPEDVKHWFETMDEWMDARSRRKIAALMLQQLEDDLLVPEAYDFICAFGKEEFSAIKNPAVADALRHHRFVNDDYADVWSKLLRQLNVAVIRYKSESAVSGPLLHSAMGL